MSVQAYRTAASHAENPRDTEYRLFGQVTRALMGAARMDRTAFQARIDALDWNRRVWSAFATACADDRNQLSPELRASIVSLSIFVNTHTSEVMRGKGEFDDLIEINRIVMQGLAPRGTPDPFADMDEVAE